MKEWKTRQRCGERSCKKESVKKGGQRHKKDKW